MFLGINSSMAWIVGGLVFGLVLSVWLIVLFVWGIRQGIEESKLKKRLIQIDGTRDDSARVLRLWKQGKNALTLSPGRTRRSMAERIAAFHSKLGVEIPIASMILFVAGMLTFGFLFAFVLTQDVLAGLGVSVLIAAALWIVAKRRIANEEAVFEKQLVEALALATRSLRAGHPLHGAFQLVVEEMDAPVSNVFAEILQQQALGKNLEEAVRTTAENTGSPDMRLFAASIVIQIRSGGNIADMMERLSAVIRDRIRLHRRARVLTAQAQLSKRVLIGVPFFMFILLYVTNRHYIEPLYTTEVGRMLLALSGVLIIVGSWAMNRIAKLEY